MPIVDPTTVQPVRQGPQQPQAQPWPGASQSSQLPSFPRDADPLKRAAQRAADIHAGVAVSGDQRGWVGVDLERQRLRQSQQEYQDKKDIRAKNGGVETTVDQDASAGHVVNLETELKILDDIKNKDPNALRPSWGEKIVGSVTQDPDYLSFVRNPQRQRASASYRNVIESVLWLKTGSAYNNQQYLGQIEALTPTMNDSPEALADKATRLQANIEAARVRAGPANVKVQQALDELEKKLPDMYGVGHGQMTGDAPKMELSGDQRSLPVPKEMQAEYSQRMAAMKPGSVTPEQYHAMVAELYRKYGYVPGDNPREGELVDQYNKTGKFGPIGASTENLEGNAKLLAAAGADKGLIGDAYAAGANFANAASLGMPMALAGEGGREAVRAANEEHPKSAFVGDMLGSVAPTMGMTAGIGAIIPKAPVVADVIANALYGGTRGQLEDTGAAMGAAGGAAGALLGRGIAHGARGFMSPETSAAIDAVSKDSHFTVPGRDPLPLSDAVPSKFQGMTDDELRAEAAKARQGIETWDAHAQRTAEAPAAYDAARAARDAKLTPVFEQNKKAQEPWLRSRGFFNPNTLPEDKQRLLQMAEREWPTTVEGLHAQDPSAVGQIFQPDLSPPSLEPRDLLQQRHSALEDYLSQSAEPKEATVPGVDLTTLSRMGGARVEDTFSGLPGIHGAHNKQIESFNLHAVGKALEDAGIPLPEGIKPGREAMAYAKNALGQRYDALLAPIQGRVTPDFGNKVAAIELQGRNIRADGKFDKQWQNVMSILDQFKNPDGTFTGQSYKNVKSRLEDLADKWSSKDLSNTDSALLEEDFRQGVTHINQLLGALEEQVTRADPMRAQQLQGLNKAYSKYIRLQKAATYARDNQGLAAPDQLLEAYYALDPSKGKSGFVTGSLPGVEWVEQAKKAIGSHSHDSSPWQSAVVPAAAVGALAAKPLIAGPAMAAALAAYTPGVKRLTQGLVDGRIGAFADKIPDLSKGLLPPSDILQRAINTYVRRKAQGE